jgi:hypothetical protein
LQKSLELLEPAILMAYCAGDIDDPETIRHVQSSEACKSWVSEQRMIRVLLKCNASKGKEGSVSSEQMKKFVSEDLLPGEMVDFENLIARNPDLLEDYLDLRMHSLAEALPGPSKKLEDSVLNLLLNNSIPNSEAVVSGIPGSVPAHVSAAQKEHSKPTVVIKEQRVYSQSLSSNNFEEPQNGSLSDAWHSFESKIIDFFSGPKLALSSGFAVFLLVAVVGAWQSGLFKESKPKPLIVASFDLPDVSLKFRGAPNRDKLVELRLEKRIPSSESIVNDKTLGETILGPTEIKLSENFVRAIKDYGLKQNNFSFESLLVAFKENIETKLMSEIEAQVSGGLDSLGGIQIHPSLWTKIKASEDPSARKLSDPIQAMIISILPSEKLKIIENTTVLYLSEIIQMKINGKIQLMKPEIPLPPPLEK